MSSSWKKWLYVAAGATAVVLLLAGVPSSDVLTFALVAAMVLMHVGGHGGLGGRVAEDGHRHGSEDGQPLSRA